jgi:hypothetical protein
MSNCGATGTAAILSIFLVGGHILLAQQTTNTNCTTVGNNTNCTSNTTDNAAQQQRAYEAGQQVGNALGRGLGAAIHAHSENKAIKSFCSTHPGWTIEGDRCLTNEDKGVIAANEFMSHHKEFIPEPANSKVLVAYLEDHKLDPREEKSYERAYKDLKKSGQLELYAK